jgi:hypothetical protein
VLTVVGLTGSAGAAALLALSLGDGVGGAVGRASAAGTTGRRRQAET